MMNPLGGFDSRHEVLSEAVVVPEPDSLVLLLTGLALLVARRRNRSV